MPTLELTARLLVGDLAEARRPRPPPEQQPND